MFYPFQVKEPQLASTCRVRETMNEIGLAQTVRCPRVRIVATHGWGSHHSRAIVIPKVFFNLRVSSKVDYKNLHFHFFHKLLTYIPMLSFLHRGNIELLNYSLKQSLDR